MRSPIAQEEPGRVLAGRYRIEGTLGAGGMGIVYLVTDLATGEPAALKVLDATRGNQEMLEGRFAREIAAVQRLTSRHAVRLLDAGTLAEGRHFMAMEYLHGEDLQGMLKREGALPTARAIRFILEACEAIGEAHALGIIHRDLKPANLFVTRLPDGGDCVKVLDFGISKLPQETVEELSLTATGTVLGSPVYMSPEQMTSSRSVDARTDIWALGVVLYRLVSGRFPYEADGMPALCAKVLTDDPRRLSEVASVSPAFEAVVMRCLARDPARRFANVAELAAALAALLEEDPDLVAPPTLLATPAIATGAAPPVASEIGPRPPPTAPRRLIWLAGGLLGLGAGVAFLWFGWKGGEPDHPEAITVEPPAEQSAPAPQPPPPVVPSSAPPEVALPAQPAATPPEEAVPPAPRRQRTARPKRERRLAPRGEFDSPLPP